MNTYPFMSWFKHLFTNIIKRPTGYEDFTRSQLINRVRQLEGQLKREQKQAIKVSERPFDMQHYQQRRIALKVTYFGWNYSGFASQNNERKIPTVEGELFKALEKCKFITNPDACNFSRCGRTDKGVSGLGQVIALDVRCSNKKNVFDREQTLPFIESLNGLLPPDIRILAWAPVHGEFNARFDCKSRTYKYFFQKTEQLSIEKMKKAASYIVGTHDFRNFCRLDPSKNITNYERTIISLDIDLAENDYYQVTLKGTAFLWHQVRCIMSILFLVGQGLEEPEVIKHLLDIQKIPAKPEYPMASHLPLLLYDCEFDNINWNYANITDANVKASTPLRTYRHVHELESEHVVKSLLYKTCMNHIQDITPISSDNNNNQLATVLLGGGKVIRSSKYHPLLDRPQGDSDEVKKEKYRLKQSRKK
ncbi:tRNA pseudouridine synthase [Backusella circina FSU 941]|nr:tRNA pseudouridine synthase [Backusella circina FSU 941]